MRSIYCRLAFITVTILLFVFAADAQKKQVSNASIEQTIKKLDIEAAKAVLDHDEKGIARYFASNSVINNTHNSLTFGSAGVIQAASNPVIDYYKFERVVESVQVLGNTAITMGQETITLKSPTGGAGAAYIRRYTNVWMRSGANWQIVARHANTICK
jgi:ketosteroid isomerase-like protein